MFGALEHLRLFVMLPTGTDPGPHHLQRSPRPP